MNINEQHIKQETQKKEFCELLRSTQREGVDYVIEDLESLGFFEAPASTRFHLNHDGGLCEHSLNVCKVGLMLREEMIKLSTTAAITITPKPTRSTRRIFSTARITDWHNAPVYSH